MLNDTGDGGHPIGNKRDKKRDGGRWVDREVEKKEKEMMMKRCNSRSKTILKRNGGGGGTKAKTKKKLNGKLMGDWLVDSSQPNIKRFFELKQIKTDLIGKRRMNSHGENQMPFKTGI